MISHGEIHHAPDLVCLVTVTTVLQENILFVSVCWEGGNCFNCVRKLRTPELPPDTRPSSHSPSLSHCPGQRIHIQQLTLKISPLFYWIFLSVLILSQNSEFFRGNNSQRCAAKEKALNFPPGQCDGSQLHCLCPPHLSLAVCDCVWAQTLMMSVSQSVHTGPVHDWGGWKLFSWWIRQAKPPHSNPIVSPSTLSNYKSCGMQLMIRANWSLSDVLDKYFYNSAQSFYKNVRLSQAQSCESGWRREMQNCNCYKTRSHLQSAHHVSIISPDVGQYQAPGLSRKQSMVEAKTNINLIFQIAFAEYMNVTVLAHPPTGGWPPAIGGSLSPAAGLSWDWPPGLAISL